MSEEKLVAGAQIIEAPFPVRRRRKAVFRTFSVTCKSDFALKTITRQRGALVHAELALLFRAGQRADRNFHDVPQPIFRIHKMVAGIKISVVFHGHGSAAGFPKYAQTLWNAQPTLERDVKYLHEATADIAPHPVIEYRTKEFSKLQRFHRPFRDSRVSSVTRSNQNKAGGVARLGLSFHQWYELHMPTSCFFEKLIDFVWPARIPVMNDSQCVEFNAMLLEITKASQNSGESRLATFVDPITVVKF